MIIKTQADAVLHFLQQLDIEMLDSILEENRTYQDFEKYVFLEKLEYTFAEFIQDGDTFLNRYPGFCDSKNCNYKCKGFTFIGNNSSNYIDLIVDIKDGVVVDIYECTLFKSINETVSKNRRIEIDNFEAPF